MHTWLAIALIVVALFVGYLIADYQAKSQLYNILDVDKANVAGKAWGIFQF